MSTRVGRVRGTPNRVGASAKENVLAVFTRLGGTHAMAEWAKANQTDFYRLYAKLIPQQIDLDVNIRECDVSAEPLPKDQWDERYSANRLTN